MKTYQYYSAKFETDVQVTFNTYGALIKFKVMDTNIHKPKWPTVLNYTDLEGFLLQAHAAKIKLTEINREVSFTEFWKAYPEKVGSKKDAEKKFNALNKLEQLQAYDYLKHLDAVLKLKGTAWPYATTYINQKRWIK